MNLTHQKLWARLLLVIAMVSVPIFAIWIGVELYYAAIATERDDILFHKEIALGVIQGATLLYLAFTLAKNWEMASAARDAAEASRATLEEMRDAREEENAPYVLIYFDIAYGKRLIDLIIKNIGKTPARNIRFRFDPPIQNTDNSIQRFSPIINGIPSIAPGQEIQTLFDFSVNYFQSTLPRTYTVNVSYDDTFTSRRREEIQILDVSMFYSRMFTTEKGIADLAESVEVIAQHMQRLVEEKREENRRTEQYLSGAEDAPDTTPELPTLGDLMRGLGIRIPVSPEQGAPPEDTSTDDESSTNAKAPPADDTPEAKG